MPIKKFYKLNHHITAPEVRVIGSDGEQIGVMSKTDALAKAQGEDLDLVEIAENAKPPVVKIIDFKKFLYLEDKKRKDARKHTKETELKEVRFSPFIGEHDLETGLKKVRKFLADGDIVKISIVFKGRQMAHQEFGPKLLERIMSLLDGATQERDARFEGRRFVTVVRGSKKQENREESTKEAEENQKGEVETNKNETKDKKSGT